MTEKPIDKNEIEESETPDKVAIEGKLPLAPIDIESQKDMEAGRYHRLRSLHKWFAARPTPAVRLAILASAYPEDIDADELLRLMQIGPKALDSDISEHVKTKFSEDRNGKKLDEHYGYQNPNTESPTQSQIDDLHDTLRDAWGGKLPTILDPTAGRGIIPFEAMRYGLSTKVCELNPVASVIIKTALDYAPEVGSLEEDFYKWRDEIHETAKQNIEPYYPTKQSENEVLNSACTYVIDCDTCGGKIPLVKKWWVNRRRSSGGGDAIRPHYDNGEIEYEHVNIPEDVTKNQYDPTEAPVGRRKAECPHCGVVVEKENIRSKIKNDNFEYSVYAVSYETGDGDWEFRAGSDMDDSAIQDAAERVESDFELLTFLTEPINVSSRMNDPTNYGMEEWRDIFNPRQLIVHYEYFRAFDQQKSKIQEQYDEERADALLTLLALVSSRSVSFNSRLCQWDDLYGYSANLFADNNYALKKMFADNNLSAARRGYKARSEQIIESYEELCSYDATGEAEVVCQDAANLSDNQTSMSADIAIVDPPYYGSILYSELSDVFYVLQKQYLNDVHTELFTSQLTDKDNEAVANPSRFENIADGDKSKDELANQFYEEKMEEIFNEVYKSLNSGGVMTVMFTHRDMEAWDTLTTALISAGFTITATHPIKTEMSDRVGLQGKSSADSSILLIGRKRADENSGGNTLWGDITSDIQQVARETAVDVLDSGYTISKTDASIAAYGPSLQKFAEEFPVTNKKGEEVRPREALGEARRAVTSVITERFLDTDGIDRLDPLSRWYILAWLTYETDTFPYDEGRQLGIGAGVNVDEVKRPTKIWGKSRGDIQLKDHTDRVQDIVRLRTESAENPSSRKYPVDPTSNRFSHTIDTIHAVLHVYEREGPDTAWDWVTERNLKSDSAFEVAVTALLEVLPGENNMYKTLVDLISGETGDYLDINVDHIDMSGVDRQTSLDDHTE
jgi:adenine-specific DNA methylase